MDSSVRNMFEDASVNDDWETVVSCASLLLAEYRLDDDDVRLSRARAHVELGQVDAGLSDFEQLLVDGRFDVALEAAHVARDAKQFVFAVWALSRRLSAIPECRESRVLRAELLSGLGQSSLSAADVAATALVSDAQLMSLQIQNAIDSGRFDAAYRTALAGWESFSNLAPFVTLTEIAGVLSCGSEPGVLPTVFDVSEARNDHDRAMHAASMLTVRVFEAVASAQPFEVRRLFDEFVESHGVVSHTAAVSAYQMMFDEFGKNETSRMYKSWGIHTNHVAMMVTERIVAVARAHGLGVALAELDQWSSAFKSPEHAMFTRVLVWGSSSCWGDVLDHVGEVGAWFDHRVAAFELQALRFESRFVEARQLARAYVVRFPSSKQVAEVAALLGLQGTDEAVVWARHAGALHPSDSRYRVLESQMLASSGRTLEASMVLTDLGDVADVPGADDLAAFLNESLGLDG